MPFLKCQPIPGSCVMASPDNVPLSARPPSTKARSRGETASTNTDNPTTGAGGLCTATCKRNGKTKNRTAMIRCCLCMRWHHTECVCIDNSDEVGFWPCPDCRNIAADMKLMREAVTTTMETTNATIRQLAYNINIISDTLSQRNFECERLLADNCDLRHKITLLTT